MPPVSAADATDREKLAPWAKSHNLGTEKSAQRTFTGLREMIALAPRLLVIGTVVIWERTPASTEHKS